MRDNTGENISHKNKKYGEYTFHYWFWKNMLRKIEDNTWIGFIDEDDRGPGISAFSLIANNKELLMNKAKEYGFLREDNIVVGGVKFYLK